MDTEEEHYYIQYFYNSVIEFVYFIIICTESQGFSFLSNICKHIKFFKSEVSDFISSFHGNTLEEKLSKMLNILKCFVLSGDEIRIDGSICVKNSIFEDLILSKSVDLVLKGITSVDKIYKNLNFNSIIFIEKKYLINLLRKSSHFSVENNFVTLHHIHRILAFEHQSCNSVTNYFQNILQDNRILSYDEIDYHSKFTTCEVHNILAVFCILYCNKHFECESSCISLRKVFKKYPKLKPVNIDILAHGMLSTSPTVGEIIHHKYGSRLQKWVGEVSALTDWSGCVYCVVDFTNGYQGFFSVYFTKASLKEISEISSLKDYLSIRDKVQFDAEYIHSQKPDRCWKASKIKSLNDTKLSYDDSLLDRLKINSGVHRKNCSSNNSFGSGTSCMNFFQYSVCSVESVKNSEIKSCNDNLFPELNKNEVNDFLASENLSKDSISNLFILDYLFMFGYVFMLMEDKGMAISEQGSKLYNILFMKDSVYTTNNSKTYPVKGQKVLLFIPFLGKLESLCVATLVYGLTENETKEIEENSIAPKDFAIDTFLPNISKETAIEFGKSCCNILNSLLTYQPKKFVINDQNKAHLHEIYDFILSHYKVMYNQNLMHFLNNLCKANSDCENISDKIIHMIIQLSKSVFKQCASQSKSRIKCRKKIKKTSNCFESSEKNNLFPNYSFSSTKDMTVKCESNIDIGVKYNSMDVYNDSCSSLTSCKSFSSSNSCETFYSCDSKPDIRSSEFLNEIECNAGDASEIPDKEIPSPHLTILNSDCIWMLRNLSEDLESKPEMRLFKNKCKKSNQSKYFCLQSFPILKPTFSKKKRFNALCHVNCLCRSCYKNSLTVMANISLISESFFFYNVNVCGYNVVLPFPRKVLPKNLEEKIKLNSCCETVVIPNTVVNLSHILAINLSC